MHTHAHTRRTGPAPKEGKGKHPFPQLFPAAQGCRSTGPGPSPTPSPPSIVQNALEQNIAGGPEGPPALILLPSGTRSRGAEGRPAQPTNWGCFCSLGEKSLKPRPLWPYSRMSAPRTSLPHGHSGPSTPAARALGYGPAFRCPHRGFFTPYRAGQCWDSAAPRRAALPGTEPPQLRTRGAAPHKLIDSLGTAAPRRAAAGRDPQTPLLLFFSLSSV